jgi:hypothetical protein
MRWVFVGLSALMIGLAAIDFHYHDWRAAQLPLTAAVLNAYCARRRWKRPPRLPVSSSP